MELYEILQRMRISKHNEASLWGKFRQNNALTLKLL